VAAAHIRTQVRRVREEKDQLPCYAKYSKKGRRSVEQTLNNEHFYSFFDEYIKN
jgi:hypothetical protein